MEKTNPDSGNKDQAERLRKTLKRFGINTEEELDRALDEALDALTIGIMTDEIKIPATSA